MIPYLGYKFRVHPQNYNHILKSWVMKFHHCGYLRKLFLFLYNYDHYITRGNLFCTVCCLQGLISTFCFDENTPKEERGYDSKHNSKRLDNF